MGVALVAPSCGYPQPALLAGPSQETHLLASSDVVDEDPEWKAGWWAHYLLLPYSIPKRSAWLSQPTRVWGATSGKEPERMWYGSIGSSPRSLRKGLI